jgi:hypothetical protein
VATAARSREDVPVVLAVVMRRRSRPPNPVVRMKWRSAAGRAAALAGDWRRSDTHLGREGEAGCGSRSEPLAGAAPWLEAAARAREASFRHSALQYF